MGKKSAPKVEKTESETPKKARKPRVARSALDTLAFQLGKATKAKEGAQKRFNHAVSVVDKVVAKLTAWGKAPKDSDAEPEYAAQIAALQSEGFTPPAGRVATAKFAENDAVKIKDKFAEKYAAHYTEEELHSMTFEFADEVNKAAVCSTDTERSVYAKLSHLEARTVS